MRVNRCSQIVVVSLPLMANYTANSFKATSAIFDLLERIEAGGVLTVAGVEASMGVSTRQARAYLLFLEERQRVVAVRRGRVKEYHPPGPAEGGRDLGRAVGTAYALVAIRALKGTAFYEEAHDGLTAEANRLKAKLGQEYGRLRHAFHAVESSLPTNPEHAEHAEEIIEALRRGLRLRGRYERLIDGGLRTYQLRPVALVLHGDRLCLLARKRDGDIRMFDVEGFHTLRKMRRGREFDPDDNPAAYFETAFGRYTHFPVDDVVLRVWGVAARQMRRRNYHHSQGVVRDEDGVLDVRFRVGRCPDFLGWVMSLVPEVEVLEPTDLREEIRDRLLKGAASNG